MSQTVARALEIIRFVSVTHRSLGDIADLLDVHKSTALRTLQTLEESGFVRRRADGRYTMGFELIALGQLALEQVESRAIAHENVLRLAESTGQTVHLAQLIGDQIVYIDKIEGHGTVAMGSRIGLAADIHTAGVAKVITAFQPGPVRDRLVAATSFDRFTDATITDRDSFTRELETIRKAGFAEDRGEREDYINCVALPIRDARGRVTHGLSVTALKAVMPLPELRARVPEFRRIADQISADFGWKGTTAHVR